MRCSWNLLWIIATISKLHPELGTKQSIFTIDEIIMTLFGTRCRNMSLRHDNIRMVIIDSQIIILANTVCYTHRHIISITCLRCHQMPSLVQQCYTSFVDCNIEHCYDDTNPLQNLYNLSMKFCNVTILHPKIFKCSYISARDLQHRPQGLDATDRENENHSEQADNRCVFSKKGRQFKINNKWMFKTFLPTGKRDLF